MQQNRRAVLLKAIASSILYLVSLALLIPPVPSTHEDRPEFLPQSAIAVAVFVTASVLGRRQGDHWGMLAARCAVFAIFSWVIFQRVTLAG